MIDLLTFPRITGDTPDKKIEEVVNYLIQTKEALEFILQNISSENLSPELINRLNELGADIKKSDTDREEALAQLSKNNVLSIYDVLNSELFKTSVKSEVTNKVSGITFTVNADTGHLEYAI